MPLDLQVIGVGTTPGDDTGDKGRVAFQKINANSLLIEEAMEDAELKAFTVKSTTFSLWYQAYPL